MSDTSKDVGNSVSSPEIQTLIAGIFPSSRYFEARFDQLQVQIDELRRNQGDIKDYLKDFKKDVDYRFAQVDKRFEQVDKRFEQIDKRFEHVDRRFEQVDRRFEQVDRRFEQIIASIDRLADKLDDRDRDQRGFTIKMFSISIMISVFGVLGTFLKLLGVF